MTIKKARVNAVDGNKDEITRHDETRVATPLILRSVLSRLIDF